VVGVTKINKERRRKLVDGSKQEIVTRYNKTKKKKKKKTKKEEKKRMEPYIGEAEQELTTAEIHEIEMKYREAERNVSKREVPSHCMINS